MSKMFGNLTATDNLEESQDRAGGGFDPFTSGVYDGVLTLAYAGESQHGAKNVTLHVDIDGKELRKTIYITNRAGENFYKDKNDASKRHPLPGFTTVDDLCLLTTGLPLTEQDTEEKTVKIYNFDERKEIPTPVACLTGMHGKPVKLGVLRDIVDVTKKNDAGKYVATGETRMENEIDKVFDPETGRTVNEFRQEIATAEFQEIWDKKNTGKDRNRAKGAAAGGGAGSSGTGRPGGSDATPKKKLFGDKG